MPNLPESALFFSAEFPATINAIMSVNIDIIYFYDKEEIYF